jgi:ribosomal protein S18 acetylase RimI-like enzyme
MLTLHSAHRVDFVVDDDLVAAWVEAVGANDSQRVRTSAVGPTTADALLSFGFTVRQELDFLVADLGGRGGSSPSTWRVGRIRPRDAVRIDIAAFGDEWALDEGAFHNSCRATPMFRVRAVRPRRALPVARPVGYCLTGASEDASYLQRLAVVPAGRRRGAAATLLDDAVNWAQSLGVQRMFVNTDVDNAAALSLYRQWGFESVGYHLRVMECDRATLLSRGGHR